MEESPLEKLENLVAEHGYDSVIRMLATILYSNPRFNRTIRMVRTAHHLDLVAQAIEQPKAKIQLVIE